MTEFSPPHFCSGCAPNYCVVPEPNIDCDAPNVDDVSGDEVVVEVNGNEVDPEPPKISALVAS